MPVNHCTPNCLLRRQIDTPEDDSSGRAQGEAFFQIELNIAFSLLYRSASGASLVVHLSITCLLAVVLSHFSSFLFLPSVITLLCRFVDLVAAAAAAVVDDDDDGDDDLGAPEGGLLVCGAGGGGR